MTVPSLAPHVARRTKIIKKYPEIKNLQGHDWRSKYICIVLLMLQHYCMLLAPRLSWNYYIFLVYFIGATISQALFLAVHEMAHNLFFKTSTSNKWFSILVNLPSVFPYAISFREYHMEHHTSQGDKYKDMDLPTDLEVRIFQTSGLKLIWLTFQIVAYAIRPILLRPKPLTYWHLINACTQCVYIYWLYTVHGLSPIYYLLSCILVSGGLHPCAGHFISEHYVQYPASDNQETFSYYGPLNVLTWNVGYHNEHHDFPRVPWSRLPSIKKIAPEYYNSLKCCTSWSKLLVLFVMHNDMGLHRRVVRN